MNSSGRKIVYRKQAAKGKFEKSSQKVWWEKKNVVPLHSLTKRYGSVAQLNRASDYGSEGSGFESQRSHFLSKQLYNGLAP